MSSCAGPDLLPLPRQALDHGAQRGRRRRARRRDAGADGTARRTPLPVRDADGSRSNLDQRKLNDYVQTHLGEGYTAKDFRTWGGTLLAAIELAQHGPRRRHRRQTANCGRDAARGREARKHAGCRALVVRQPCGDRAVSRRKNHRGFPPSTFAGRRRPRYRSRSRGAGDLELAAIVANSPSACRKLS